MKFLVGERRALAAAVLAMYGFLFLLVGFNPPSDSWRLCFFSLAGIYGLGFLAVVAGYFWGRWFAMGLGISGSISAAFSMWQIGMEPVLMFYGGTHVAIALMLWGKAMSLNFDGRKEWRERFHLDEAATERLGKAVVRVGTSLPYILMYALAPRDGQGMALLAVLVGAVAVVSVAGLFKLRTWSIFGLLGAGVAALALGLSETVATQVSQVSDLQPTSVNLAWFAGLGMVLATTPFWRPLVSALKK